MNWTICCQMQYDKWKIAIFFTDLFSRLRKVSLNKNGTKWKINWHFVYDEITHTYAHMHMDKSTTTTESIQLSFTEPNEWSNGVYLIFFFYSKRIIVVIARVQWLWTGWDCQEILRMFALKFYLFSFRFVSGFAVCLSMRIILCVFFVCHLCSIFSQWHSVAHIHQHNWTCVWCVVDTATHQPFWIWSKKKSNRVLRMDVTETRRVRYVNVTHLRMTSYAQH